MSLIRPEGKSRVNWQIASTHYLDKIMDGLNNLGPLCQYDNVHIHVEPDDQWIAAILVERGILVPVSEHNTADYLFNHGFCAELTFDERRVLNHYKKLPDTCQWR